jgi:hypothetical protein
MNIKGSRKQLQMAAIPGLLFHSSSEHSAVQPLQIARRLFAMPEWHRLGLTCISSGVFAALDLTSKLYVYFYIVQGEVVRLHCHK